MDASSSHFSTLKCTTSTVPPMMAACQSPAGSCQPLSAQRLDAPATGRHDTAATHTMSCAQTEEINEAILRGTGASRYELFRIRDRGGGPGQDRRHRDAVRR